MLRRLSARDSLGTDQGCFLIYSHLCGLPWADTGHKLLPLRYKNVSSKNLQTYVAALFHYQTDPANTFDLIWSNQRGNLWVRSWRPFSPGWWRSASQRSIAMVWNAGTEKSSSCPPCSSQPLCCLSLPASPSTTAKSWVEKSVNFCFKKC